MKPKKLGRPVSENPRDKIVKFRMDSKEIKTLGECAKKLNMSRSDVIRQGISRIYADLK